MLCANCGNNCADDMDFCTNCGTRLNTTQPSDTEPVQTVYQEPTVPEKENNSKGPGFALSIPAMVLGILSIINYNILFGIAGIIMSSISLSKGKEAGKKHKMASVGLVCSIIGIIIGIIVTVLSIIYYIALMEAYMELLEEFYALLEELLSEFLYSYS